MAALHKSFELDKSLAGEILQIKDDFAVGPIGYSFSEEEITNRKQWWRETLQGGDYEGIVNNGKIDDWQTISKLTAYLNEEPDGLVWIWAAQNKHDVSGYYWLISQMKAFQGRVFILYLNNLPFISEKGNIFYPKNIFEIPAKEFIKAKKLARPVTLSEFEMDADEWKRLCNEEKGVRTLEGGKKIVQHGYDYYDDEIMKYITGDWQRVNKLFHGLFSKSENTTGDAYLLWRVKSLITAGKIDAQGEIKNMKDFEVKRNEE